jgi:hypothetical protein
LRFGFVVVMFLFLGVFNGAWAAQPGAPIPYQVQLRSRQFVPPPGVDTGARASLSAASKPQHLFIQLNDIPSPDEQARLARSGIRLLHYLPDRTWLASVDPALVKAPEKTTNLRWMGSIAQSDKVPANLFAGKPLSHAIRQDGLLELQVKYFDDVSESDAVAAVARHGGIFEQSFAVTHRIGIRLPSSQIKPLSAEDGLEWIEEAPPPPVPEVDSIRSRIRVNEVQAAPYNLNGSGVRLGIWDCSAVGPHIDFSGRLTVWPGTTRSCPTAENHATHVAGIMAGSGQNSQNQGGAPSQWKGMAPSASIYSYDFNNFGSTVPAAQSTNGIDLAQNSWGYADCPHAGKYYFGDFYDAVVRGTYGKSIPVVFF